MRRFAKPLVRLLAGVMILLLVGPVLSQGSPLPQLQNYPIRLKAGAFFPTAGQTLPIPESLQARESTTGQAQYYIVQFNGPIEQVWKDGVIELGGKFHGYIPDFAFKVKLNSGQVDAVQALDFVRWVGVFEPAYRLDPDISRGDAQLYRVRFEAGSADAANVRALIATGAEISRYDDGSALVLANSPQLDALAYIVEVAWIEDFFFYEKHNEYGAGQIIGGAIANANGYNGSTQIVAVADTGLGTGVAATAHPDVPASRIVAIQDFPATSSPFCYNAFPDGALDPDSGHGTHVALSVLGDGGINGVGQGSAPAASLVFQSVEDYIDTIGFCGATPDGYYLVGLPDPLGNLYLPAYNAGARIHSNSWGSNAAGDYTADSAATDQFIWNNPDMLISFSAGNSGVDTNNNGVVDNDSIGSPATAKNVLTVGASEGERADNFACDTGLSYTSSDSYQAGQTCTSMGGENAVGTAGQRWGFSTEPLASDPSGGNANQMAPFSSRGPTDDGRIKPDIVAPGTWILSGYSDMFQQGYDGSPNPQNGLFQSDGWGMPFNDDYKYFGGTSMSNPIAAGGAAVVRDFYQKSEGHAASAALVKGTLINSAVDLLDENNDGANDNDFPIPNVHEGWGRIDLAAATDGSHIWVDNAGGLSTGQSDTYNYNVTAGTTFKVTLVWSDFPSTETAAVNLVNNLNLTVTSPGGTVYRGNVFSGGWSTSGGSSDSVNNVENVYIQAAEAGTWTVTINGSNVPQSAQPYALVVDGQSGTGPTPTPTNTPVAPTPTPTNTPVTPSPTPVAPTSTPTNTPVAPSPTPVVPTNTPTPTNTPVAPTPTPTNTPVAPSPTPIVPTNTPVPPTSTPPPSGGDILYVSSTSGGNVGFGFSDEDILAYDTATGTWSKYFDGSDVGLSGSSYRDVDAFHVRDDGSILLSITVASSIPDVGAIDDSDIVLFTPSSLGNNTSGTFSMYFDGSDVGLTTNGEDIDAIYETSSGDLFISTKNRFSVPGVSGLDEDLIRFTPTSFGSNTAGSWSVAFDGSDVGLSNTSGEDVNGVWHDEAINSVYLTTAGSFSVSGASGDWSDIIECASASLGSSTSCNFSLFWDGSANGFSGELVDGLSINRP